MGRIKQQYKHNYTFLANNIENGKLLDIGKFAFNIKDTVVAVSPEFSLA